MNSLKSMDKTHIGIVILCFFILGFSIFLLTKSNSGSESFRFQADPNSSQCAASKKTFVDSFDLNLGPEERSKLLGEVMTYCGPDTLLPVPTDPTALIRQPSQMNAAQIVNLSNTEWCDSIQNSNVTNWGPYDCNPHSKYINYY